MEPLCVSPAQAPLLTDCEVYGDGCGEGAGAFSCICSFGSRLNTSALIQVQRHLPSEGGGEWWGETPSPGYSSRSLGLGAMHVPLPTSQTGPFLKQGKKKKAQFENLLPKEGYTCGRGSGECGARLWGRGGLAGTDWEDLAPVRFSSRGLPGSVRGREAGEDCLV